MNYRIIDKDGKSVLLPTKVKKAANYREIYAHGASGGLLANYHYRIDFYQDIFPPLEYEALGNKVQPESITGVEREVVASVYLPLPFLKELKNWLDKNISSFEEEYGEIQLPKGVEGSSDEGDVEPLRREA